MRQLPLVHNDNRESSREICVVAREKAGRHWLLLGPSEVDYRLACTSILTVISL